MVPWNSVFIQILFILGRDLRIERALAFLINFSFLEAMGRRRDKPGIAILTAGTSESSGPRIIFSFLFRKFYFFL